MVPLLGRLCRTTLFTIPPQTGGIPAAGPRGWGPQCAGPSGKLLFRVCCSTGYGAAYSTLKEQCKALAKEQKVKDGDADSIQHFVCRYLSETCSYSDTSPQSEDGKNPVLYFLNESKTGSSPQFASAAVVPCRIMGLPARYVVGYAAPKNLFYTASRWQLQRSAAG